MNLVGVAVPSGDLSLDYVRLPAEKNADTSRLENIHHVQIPSLSLKREWLVVFSYLFRRFQLLVLRGISSSFSFFIYSLFLLLLLLLLLLSLSLLFIIIIIIVVVVVVVIIIIIIIIWITSFVAFHHRSKYQCSPPTKKTLILYVQQLT